MTASNGSTPEWFATTRAAPLSGILASPRDWTRNQFRYSASAAGISRVEFRSGSKPNSSISKSRARRRRVNSAASASRRPQRGGPADAYALTAARLAGYFLLRRWPRVWRSSLRCFFLAILLRRFLMTEPTTPPSLDVQGPSGMPAHARHPPAGHRPTFLTRQRHRLPSQPGALSQG